MSRRGMLPDMWQTRSRPTGPVVVARHRHSRYRVSKYTISAVKSRQIPPALYRALPMLASEEDCPCCQPLSIWNQSAPRVYICVVLCFPCEDSRRDDITRHLEQALQRLARRRPIFAGRLHASSSGRVSIHRSTFNDIPFTVHEPTTGEKDYKRMRSEGFPPASFVDSRYGISGKVSRDSEAIPVSRVEAEFARGGLLLSVYLHHGLVDGGSLKIFLETLAAETRGDASDLPSEQTFKAPVLPPKPMRRRQGYIHDLVSFKRQVAKCPEYSILPDMSGPTQPRFHKAGVPMSEIERTGKIFVFSNERLMDLRERIRLLNDSLELPSAYTSLAALAFAHITKARTKVERYLPGAETSQTAMLWNSVNWRTRAFQDITTNYFGNAALPAVTKVSSTSLLDACYDDQDLARLVPAVKASIDEVDEEYVGRRLAMLSQAPDPRLVGVNYDPRMADALAFNTWRHFGADVEWQLEPASSSPAATTVPDKNPARCSACARAAPASTSSGTDATSPTPVQTPTAIKPEAIRRAHGGWNLGTALILPARAAAPSQELFVSLSVEAMELLCADEGWMRWVDRVIG